MAPELHVLWPIYIQHSHSRSLTHTQTETHRERNTQRDTHRELILTPREAMQTDCAQVPWVDYREPRASGRWD